MPDIDRSLDRLDDALRGAGFPGLEPPSDASALEEVVEEVRPFTLPHDLHRFWERVDVASVAVAFTPVLFDSGSALETHRQNLEPAFRLVFGPPLLFPISVDHTYQRSVELSDDSGPGGTVFDHDDAIRIEYATFADLVETWAELIEAGRFIRFDGHGVVDDPSVEREHHLRASRPHPRYGDLEGFPADPAGWPAHWLAAAGIDLHDREPLGRTHSIAEVVRAATSEPLEARIVGTVVLLMGSSEGSLARIDDGTGTVDVWCPAGTSPWGPKHRQAFELEVVVAGPVPRPPDLDTGEVSRHALAGRIEAAQEAWADVAARFEEYRPAAVATAIRPIGE